MTEPRVDESPQLPPLREPTWVGRVRPIRLLELFEKYRRKVVHRETQLPFEPSRSPHAMTIERLAFETGWGMRVALKVFVPICAVLFGVSFLWDFHSLIRSCSVAGMIGFATNWVAIKMLFWPRDVRPIFGQGLIPSQRDQLIDKVADQVLENLINEELILRKIDETRIVERFSHAAIDKLEQVTRDPEFKRDVRDMVLTYLAELTSNPGFRLELAARVEQGVEELAGSGFKSWAVRKLRTAWRGPLAEVVNQQLEGIEDTLDGSLEHLDEVLERLPRVLEAREPEIDKVLTRMLVGLVREVDVREIVLDQLSTITTVQLERGFREFSDDKLSFITLLGGILGVVGGTVIVWPLPSLGVLAALGVVLTVLDVAIKPLMGSRFWPTRAR